MIERRKSITFEEIAIRYFSPILAQSLPYCNTFYIISDTLTRCVQMDACEIFVEEGENFSA